MSSRQEEKEQRRREREEAERKAAKSGAQRKRLGIVLGAVLAAAIAVIIVLAVTTGGDEGANQSVGDAALPPFEITNAAEAARAAGCRLTSPQNVPGEHTEEPVEYPTATPTSGSHSPSPAEDGVYAAGNPPPMERTLHALEHGRIAIQYRKGMPAAEVNRLEALTGFEVKGSAGYKLLLFENPLGMEQAVAATAWDELLTCPAMNDKVFDALRAFWRTKVDRGPESVPFQG